MNEWQPVDPGSPESMTESAMAMLETERRKLAELNTKMNEETTTVRSKDRSLSMTFDGRGELTSMAFQGTKYRTMAPAQLAHVIVETLNLGRAQCMEKLTGVMGNTPVLPGVDFAGLASGKTSPSEVFESLLSPLLGDAADSGVLGRPSQNGEEPRHG